MMRLRFPLYLQTLGMLFLYLAILALVGFVSFNSQFGVGWQALVESPLGDRLDTIADAISSQLRSSSREQWTEILKTYGDTYHVKFYVFQMSGRQAAGDVVALPRQLNARFMPPDVGLPPFGAMLPPPPDVGLPPSGAMPLPPPDSFRPQPKEHLDFRGVPFGPGRLPPFPGPDT